MSDNKYKKKTEKEKKKCEKIINKLYGDNYYFLHGTTDKSIENILKSGKLKLGTQIEERNFNYNENAQSLPYIYCTIEFDNVNVNYEPVFFEYILLLHPKILFENDNVIFNKRWNKYPNSDSIYINKEDNFDNKKQKIKEIKEYLIELKQTIELQKVSKFNQNYHEILFIKDINLKDNLMGIVCNDYYYKNYKQIQELLKKYDYNNVKIYNEIKEFPLLCDLLI